MTAISLESDLEFKDARDYVNSSSLTTDCYRALAESGLANTLDGARVDGAFARMVASNGTYWASPVEADLPERSRLSARFVWKGPAATVYAGFEADEHLAIRRRVPTRRRVDELEITGPYAGHAVIEVGSLLLLLENAVEANKRLHIASVAGRGTPRVVNTYLKGVPAVPSLPPGLQRLEIANVGSRDDGRVVTTLNRLWCPSAPDVAFELAFQVHFGEQP